MGPDTTCIHCTDSTDAELDLLAASGAFTSVAPYVEMLMGHGMPPTGKLLKRGIRPSLSIDVASSVPGDMFTQMRTALVAERILSTATPRRRVRPRLTHKDVLEFATLQGARALGMAQTIGSLEVGKQADVVLLDTRKVNTQPVVDPEGTVVVYADTSNIDTVMVGAVSFRKRHGQLVANRLSEDFTLLDNSRDDLLNAAGMKRFNV